MNIYTRPIVWKPVDDILELQFQYSSDQIPAIYVWVFIISRRDDKEKSSTDCSSVFKLRCLVYRDAHFTQLQMFPLDRQSHRLSRPATCCLCGIESTHDTPPKDWCYVESCLRGQRNFENNRRRSVAAGMRQVSGVGQTVLSLLATSTLVLYSLQIYMKRRSRWLGRLSSCLLNQYRGFNSQRAHILVGNFSCIIFD